MTAKLAVFDYDSTLMNGETASSLAERYGCIDEIHQANENSVTGKHDIFDSLKIYGRCLKGMDYNEVLDVCKHLPYNKGTSETIATLKERGYTVICFSGGFTVATEMAKDILGLDATFANILHHKEGKLTGEISGPMTTDDAKGIYIVKMQHMLKVSKDNTIVIGDGANDISMFAHAGISFAYCSHSKKVRDAATIIIDNPDMTEILKYI